MTVAGAKLKGCSHLSIFLKVDQSVKSVIGECLFNIILSALFHVILYILKSTCIAQVWPLCGSVEGFLRKRSTCVKAAERCSLFETSVVIWSACLTSSDTWCGFIRQCKSSKKCAGYCLCSHVSYLLFVFI